MCARECLLAVGRVKFLQTNFDLHATTCCKRVTSAALGISSASQTAPNPITLHTSLQISNIESGSPHCFISSQQCITQDKLSLKSAHTRILFTNFLRLIILFFLFLINNIIAIFYLINYSKIINIALKVFLNCKSTL